jgi:hypothetical protein
MIVAYRPAYWLAPLALASLGASSGCSDVLGPEHMPVTSVVGKLTQNGRPVAGGWIEFVPVDGTVGKLHSARIKADGTFHAEHVSVGLNLIRLVNIDITDTNVKWLFGAFHSPIRRDIPPRANAPVKIDLVDEWNLFREEFARQRSFLSRQERPR